MGTLLVDLLEERLGEELDLVGDVRGVLHALGETTRIGEYLGLRLEFSTPVDDGFVLLLDEFVLQVLVVQLLGSGIGIRVSCI